MISLKKALVKELTVKGLRAMGLITITMNITMIIMMNIMKSITGMITTVTGGSIIVTRMIMETMAPKFMMVKRRKKITEVR